MAFARLIQSISSRIMDGCHTLTRRAKCVLPSRFTAMRSKRGAPYFGIGNALVSISSLIVLCSLLVTVGCSSKDEPNAATPSDSSATAQNDSTEKSANAHASATDTNDAAADTLDVTIKGETFHLELALDEASRFQGLSDRPEIPVNGGMLFVFKSAQPREFVMRRCLVPINIAFLDSEGKVVWMHAMQVESDPDTPEYRLKRYDSHYPAQFAIELRDGSLRRLGLQQGDHIELPLEDLKARVR